MKASHQRVQMRRDSQTVASAPQIQHPLSHGGLAAPSRHLCEFLLAIEPDIAALAAARRSAGQARLFGRLVDSSRDALGPREWIGSEIALQQAIAELSGNLFFQALQTLVMTALSSVLLEVPVWRLEMLHQDLVGPNRLLASAIADGDDLRARTGALGVIHKIELALAMGNGN